MTVIKGWIKGVVSKKPGFWFFQLIGWGLLSLYFFSSYYPFINLYKHPVGWALSVFIGFSISLLLRIFYRKLYDRKPGITTIFLVVSIFSVVSGVVWFLVRTLILTPFESSINPGVQSVVNTSLFDVSYNTIFYVVDYTWPIFVWSALYFGIKFWMDMMDEKSRSEKSALLVQTARLRLLRYQLNPHFLFNSLSSIQALIYDDPERADRVLTELSDFLRFSIHDNNKLYIPLREEVEIAKKYLSVEKTRFPDRLNFKINISDRASEIEVVAFILQPLVENAVKYGMKTSPENLLIEIKGYVETDRLYIEIKNNGGWVEPVAHEGTGINNVFERLQNAYPDKFKFNIEKGTDTVTVIIEIHLD